MVEVYKDVALRLCPISHEQALEMISEVKAAQLLKGFRGKPAGDVEALARVLVRVSQMGVQLEGQLAELDINPLVVLPEGRGVTALDSLVYLRSP
jgi:acetyltransferase